jgi:hypothetical protein
MTISVGVGDEEEKNIQLSKTGAVMAEKESLIERAIQYQTHFR